jgi:hypothetical protein
MDPHVLNFLIATLGVTVSVAIGAGVYTLIANKLRAPFQAPANDEIEELRSRLDTLEGTASRFEELGERLDFVERVLSALKEGRAASVQLPPRKERTPV